MKRRQFLTGSAVCATTLSGCTSFGIIGGGRPEERNFTAQVSSGLIRIHNRRDADRELSVRITSGNQTRTENVDIATGNATTIYSPFSLGHGVYEFHVSDGDVRTNQTVDPTQIRYNQLTFVVTDAGIDFSVERRDPTDFVVVNQLRDTVSVKITVRNTDTGERFFGTVTVPGEGLKVYRGVLDNRTDYDVKVDAEGNSDSTSFPNSTTSSLTITIRSDGMDLSIGDE